MWNHLTSHLEPRIGRPDEHRAIPFDGRDAGEPRVIFYGRNAAGGVSLHLPYSSGYGEWPDHIDHWLMPQVGLLEVGTNSERLWGVHVWETNPDATILRIQALLTWGRERTRALGPREGYSRLESSLDFDRLESSWMDGCEEHWLLKCLRLPIDTGARVASPLSVHIAGQSRAS